MVYLWVTPTEGWTISGEDSCLHNLLSGLSLTTVEPGERDLGSTQQGWPSDLHYLPMSKRWQMLNRTCRHDSKSSSELPTWAAASRIRRLVCSASCRQSNSLNCCGWCGVSWPWGFLASLLLCSDKQFIHRDSTLCNESLENQRENNGQATHFANYGHHLSKSVLLKAERQDTVEFYYY